eukprot:351955-Chlamydomonas_euryale.AAC.21
MLRASVLVLEGHTAEVLVQVVHLAARVRRCRSAHGLRCHWHVDATVAIAVAGGGCRRRWHALDARHTHRARRQSQRAQQLLLGPPVQIARRALDRKPQVAGDPGVRQQCGRVGPHTWVLDKRAPHKVAPLVGVVRGEVDVVLVQDVRDRLDLVLDLERRPPTHELIRKHTRSPHIHCAAERLDLLGLKPASTGSAAPVRAQPGSAVSTTLTMQDAHVCKLRKGGRTDRRTDGQADGWIDGLMDGWMDGQMVGRSAHLGCHVVERSAATERQLALPAHRKPKVSKPQASSPRQKNVLGLDVTMHVLERVHLFQHAQQRRDDLHAHVVLV